MWQEYQYYSIGVWRGLDVLWNGTGVLKYGVHNEIHPIKFGIDSARFNSFTNSVFNYDFVLWLNPETDWVNVSSALLTHEFHDWFWSTFHFISRNIIYNDLAEIADNARNQT